MTWDSHMETSGLTSKLCTGFHPGIWPGGGYTESDHIGGR